jgi:hypothetical protein
MRKRYVAKNLLFFSVSALLFTITSCSNKKTPTPTPVVVTATPTKLGLYEASDTSSDTVTYKEIFMPILKIGTQTINTNYNTLVFDTGSGGMVIDATGILPASMITSTGFNFTGDSTVYDGITITNQTSTVSYGDDANTSATVHGNLAYASVTIGVASGNIVVKRLPFFIYYKAEDGKGNKFDAHEFDVFGVNTENDITFPNTVSITSPFSYFDPGTGLTKGFKLAALGNNFTDADQIPLTPNVVTLGLTADDLSSSSGFIMHQLSVSPSYPDDGYIPVLPGTINYNGTAVTAEILFDTGTDPYNYLEDRSAAKTVTKLPINTTVSLATSAGFDYSFTTGKKSNLTYVENPAASGVDISIFSLEFFINNEYMLDFTHHKLGVKSN